MTVPGQALAIPEPTQIVPAGFHENVRAQVAEIEDVADLGEVLRRLLALERYVKDKAQRFEVQAAARWDEMRIGQILDVQVSPDVARERNHIKKDDRHRFRLLAAHPDIVEWCIYERRNAARKFILDEIRKRRHVGRETIGATAPTITRSDAVDWLATQPECDLLLTDPPYSTDVDNIDRFARWWLPEALKKVKPTGRAYVCIGAYPRELYAYLDVPTGDLTLANVLVWTYRNTLGPSPSHDYKLNWQAILYYRGSDAEPLDCPEMVEQFSVQDINAPDGRHGDRWHAWQKPDELGHRFVRHATSPGDLVLDPFAGTGTFLLAAARLGRRATGCDISEEHITIAQERGCVVEE